MSDDFKNIEPLDAREWLLWNTAYNIAIEVAALIVQPVPHVDEERRCEDIAVAIRKLKK